MITARTKIFGIGAGIAGMLALAALSGMLFLIQQKAAAYEVQRHARAMHAAAEKELQSLEALVSETAGDREALARYILTEDSVVDFLSRIEDLARVQGVAAETRSLAVEPMQGTDVFEQLTLEVAVTGPFASVTQILPLLESLPYQAHVRTVLIERAEGAARSDQWHAAYRVYVTKYK